MTCYNIYRRRKVLNKIVAVFVLTLALSACENPSPPIPPNEPAPPIEETDWTPRLLTEWGWQKGEALLIEDFMYRPTAAPAPYTNWDILETTNVRDRNFQFLVTLEREATIALAWPAGSTPPDWGWAPREGVTVSGVEYNVWSSVLGEGTNLLPEFGELGSPLFLITESDESVLPIPTTDREQPRPNETCPSWLHDEYILDSGSRTWHPQIHPVFACGFGHEHGSDPSLFSADLEVSFDRYGGLETPLGDVLLSEQHEGFKVFVTSPHDGVQMLITLHATSSSIHRVCARFHTTDIVLADEGGEVLADLSFKGDYGWPRIDGDVRPEPDACQDVQEINSGGRIDLRNPDAGIGYEAWLQGLGTTVFPFEGKLFWGLDNPQTKCGDMDCNSAIPVGLPTSDGTRRWIDFREGFAIPEGGPRGNFYTDVFGMGVVPSGENSVQQYIAQGFEWFPRRARFSVRNPFTALYEPSLELSVFNLDRNINKQVPVPGDN